MSRYVQTIFRLLPPGIPFLKRPGSKLWALAEALSAEATRVGDRVTALLQESDPRTSEELLGDFERILGLPGIFDAYIKSESERRGLVIWKYAAREALTKAFYVALAGRVGYTITTDDISDDAETHVFSVTLPASTILRADCEDSRCTDRLDEFGDELIESVILAARPAHARVIFQYV